MWYMRITDLEFIRGTDGDGVHRGVGDESREGFGAVVGAGRQAGERQCGDQGFDVVHGVGFIGFACCS